MDDAEGESRTITYADLQSMVNKATNALVEMGVATLTDPTVVNMISDLMGTEANSED